MDEKTRDQLLDMIDGFSGKKVLVLGDAIVDEFIFGKAFGESLDSKGTKKILHEKTNYFRGGAGNVVKNLLALGAEVCFITVLGEDEHAVHYNEWDHPNLKIIAFSEPDRKTIVKTRFSDENERHLELEKLDFNDISKETEEKIIDATNEESSKSEVIIFQDQGHGFFSDSLIEKLKEMLADSDKEVLVNSQTYLRKANHDKYKGLHKIFLNLDEIKEFDTSFGVEKDGSILKEKLDSEICVTLGDKGAVLFGKNEKHYSHGININAIDTCGAGDSFLAAFAVSNFENDPNIALRFASVWAGLSTLKKGTETSSLQELRDYINSEQ